jgi:histidine ammonia-lyase
MVEGEAHPGRAVSAAHEAIRARIAFLEHDRALDGDVRAALALVEEGAVLAAARAVVP